MTGRPGSGTGTRRSLSSADLLLSPSSSALLQATTRRWPGLRRTRLGVAPPPTRTASGSPPSTPATMDPPETTSAGRCTSRELPAPPVPWAPPAPPPSRACVPRPTTPPLPPCLRTPQHQSTPSRIFCPEGSQQSGSKQQPQDVQHQQEGDQQQQQEGL